MRLKSSSGKWRPSCLGLVVLIVWFAYVIVCKTGRHSPAHGAAISRRTCPSEGLTYWPQTRQLELCSGGNWCHMGPNYYNCTSVLVMEIIGALLKSDLFKQLTLSVNCLYSYFPLISILINFLVVPGCGFILLMLIKELLAGVMARCRRATSFYPEHGVFVCMFVCLYFFRDQCS